MYIREGKRITLQEVQEALKLKSRNAVFKRVGDKLLAPPVKDGKFNFWYESDLIAYENLLKSQYSQPTAASSEHAPA